MTSSLQKYVLPTIPVTVCFLASRSYSEFLGACSVTYDVHGEWYGELFAPKLDALDFNSSSKHSYTKRSDRIFSASMLRTLLWLAILMVLFQKICSLADRVIQFLETTNVPQSVKPIPGEQAMAAICHPGKNTSTVKAGVRSMGFRARANRITPDIGWKIYATVRDVAYLCCAIWDSHVKSSAFYAIFRRFAIVIVISRQPIWFLNICVPVIVVDEALNTWVIPDFMSCIGNMFSEAACNLVAEMLDLSLCTMHLVKILQLFVLLLRRVGSACYFWSDYNSKNSVTRIYTSKEHIQNIPELYGSEKSLHHDNDMKMAPDFSRFDPLDLYEKDISVFLAIFDCSLAFIYVLQLYQTWYSDATAVFLCRINSVFFYKFLSK